jgi:hypothetical protein
MIPLNVAECIPSGCLPPKAESGFTILLSQNKNIYKKSASSQLPP